MVGEKGWHVMEGRCPDARNSRSVVVVSSLGTRPRIHRPQAAASWRLRDQWGCTASGQQTGVSDRIGKRVSVTGSTGHDTAGGAGTDGPPPAVHINRHCWLSPPVLSSQDFCRHHINIERIVRILSLMREKLWVFRPVLSNRQTSIISGRTLALLRGFALSGEMPRRIRRRGRTRTTDAPETVARVGVAGVVWASRAYRRR